MPDRTATAMQQTPQTTNATGPDPTNPAHMEAQWQTARERSAM